MWVSHPQGEVGSFLLELPCEPGGSSAVRGAVEALQRDKICKNDVKIVFRPPLRLVQVAFAE